MSQNGANDHCCVVIFSKILWVQDATLLPAPMVKGETTRNARGISKHSEMGKESRQERVIIITEGEAEVTCLLELIGLRDAEMMPKRSGHCGRWRRGKGSA